MERKKRKVWLDCDPGHDDAMMIMLAGHHPDLEVIGISTESGNQTIEKTTKNALFTCAISGLNHIPIVKGQESPIMRPTLICPEIHGNSGLDTGKEGASPFPRERMEKIIMQELVEEKAVVYIAQMIAKHGGVEPQDQIDLVCTGSVTNIALLLTIYPELKKYIRQIVMLGGAMGVGNCSPCAEWNYMIDPEAAKIVFQHSDVKLVQIPLEVSHTVLVNPNIFQFLRELKSPFAQLMIDLLSFFSLTYKTMFNFEHPPLHDPLTIAYIVNPELFETQFLNVEIETSSVYSPGRSVVDIWRTTGRKPNAHVAFKIDVEGFWKLMFAAWERANKVSPLNIEDK